MKLKFNIARLPISSHNNFNLNPEIRNIPRILVKPSDYSRDMWFVWISARHVNLDSVPKKQYIYKYKKL